MSQRDNADVEEEFTGGRQQAEIQAEENSEGPYPKGANHTTEKLESKEEDSWRCPFFKYIATWMEKKKVLKYTRTPKQENLLDMDSRILHKIEEKLSVKLTEERWPLDDPNVPCIVFCVYASRLGADVDEVFPDHKESPIILVILHPIAKGLPSENLASYNSMLPDSVKTRTKKIIHFAFSKDQGVYSCEQNKESFNQLAKTLQEYCESS